MSNAVSLCKTDMPGLMRPTKLGSNLARVAFTVVADQQHREMVVPVSAAILRIFAAREQDRIHLGCTINLFSARPTYAQGMDGYSFTLGNCPASEQ